MAAEFRANPHGVAEMLRAPFMVAALERVAERGKAAAERNTPVDTGRMKASWKTWAGVRDGRAAAQIYNVAANPTSGFQYPRIVERGAHNQPRQRPLGRAIDEMTIRS